MLTVYISQPMTGRDETDIIEERGRAAEEIKAIYGKDVEICDSYRTDIEQDKRNSIILEEIINVLGISDSELRTDSIVYQYSNENTSLSDIDLLILKLLYHPNIECGMNYSQCEQIIKGLYY